MKAKVQHYRGIYIIVQTADSTNRHYSRLNRECEIEKVLTNEEILEHAKNLMTHEDKIKAAKDYLKKVHGYATSNVKSPTIDHNDIVKLKVKSTNTF